MQLGGQRAVNVVEFHPRHYQAQLEHLFQIWPKGPLAPAVAAGASSQIAFSRWSCADQDEPFEIASDVDHLEHVVTVPLVRSNVFYDIGSRPIQDGEVVPGHMLLTGPITQPSRAIYRAAFDTFRIYLADTLIMEAIEGVTGRPLQSSVQLFGPHAVDDKVLRGLVMSAVAVTRDEEPFGLACLESIGLVLATHLVGRYFGPAVARPNKRISPLAEWRLKRVVDYVESSLARDIPLSELSAVAGLSRMHFAAQFRAAMGVSPHTYILRRKISKARELLTESETSVEDVAFTLGFKSAAYFARAFRLLVGVPPSRWRKSYTSS